VYSILLLNYILLEMDKNVRKNPFGHVETSQQQTMPPKLEKTTLPPKTETVKTTLPPKFKAETEEKKLESQPVPQPLYTESHYSEERSNLISSEYEAIKQFNSPKSYMRLTTERLPANPSLMKESALPFSIIINPLNSYETEVCLI
jgi:hypothetical protein